MSSEGVNEMLRNGDFSGDSLDSFRNTYKLHMKFVKGTSVVLLMTPLFVLTCMTLGLSLQTLSRLNVTTCAESNRSRVDLNSTLCTYINQFPLTEEVYATVCLFNGETRLDIRYFSRGRATVKGIYIDRRQFRHLKRYIYHIDHEMNRHYNEDP